MTKLDAFLVWLELELNRAVNGVTMTVVIDRNKVSVDMDGTTGIVERINKVVFVATDEFVSVTMVKPVLRALVEMGTTVWANDARTEYLFGCGRLVKVCELDGNCGLIMTINHTDQFGIIYGDKLLEYGFLRQREFCDVSRMI